MYGWGAVGEYIKTAESLTYVICELPDRPISGGLLFAWGIL